MFLLIDSAVGSAGFEPDHANTRVPATIPIGNNHPRQPQDSTR